MINNTKELENEIRNCNKCNLRQTLPECTYPVSHSGPYDSKLMIIGECSGENEIIEGIPFCGESGKLLNRMLKSAGINRNEIFVTNCVKCWSRTSNGKRNCSLDDENIKICKFWLWNQIKLISPKIIVTCGAVSTKLLLKLKKSVKFGNYVGKTHSVDFGSFPIIPIFHPSFLLQRRTDLINNTIEILKSVKEILCTPQQK